MVNTNKKLTETNGWILIGLILFLFILTIFAGQFFKSENKLKVIFDNKQTVSSFVAIYNSNNEIIKAFTIFLNTETNRVSSVYILPQTYLSFNKNGKTLFFSLSETINKDISKDEIKNGISKLLGTNINYFIFLKDDNFIKYIDLIGGVKVFTEEISIPEKNIYYPSGVINLDGDKAIEFLTLNVSGDNEYEPLKRMEVFVRSLINLEEDFLELINDQIVSNYIYPLFITNLSVSDSIVFFKEIKKRFNQGVTDYSRYFIGTIVYCDKDQNDGKSIFHPKKSGNWIKGEVKEALTNLKKRDFKDTGNKITVQLLNGTDIVGFASRSKLYIESFGFDVIETGNADNHEYENTVILVRSSEQKALKLADLIKCKKVTKTNAIEDTKIDVTLILGRDFDGRIVK